MCQRRTPSQPFRLHHAPALRMPPRCQVSTNSRHIWMPWGAQAAAGQWFGHTGGNRLGAHTGAPAMPPAAIATPATWAPAPKPEEHHWASPRASTQVSPSPSSLSTHSSRLHGGRCGWLPGNVQRGNNSIGMYEHTTRWFLRAWIILRCAHQHWQVSETGNHGSEGMGACTQLTEVEPATPTDLAHGVCRELQPLFVLIFVPSSTTHARLSTPRRRTDASGRTTGGTVRTRRYMRVVAVAHGGLLCTQQRTAWGVGPRAWHGGISMVRSLARTTSATALAAGTMLGMQCWRSRMQRHL